MQAQVPQYIEIEDKVIGPLTIRQFIYLVIGMGIIGLMWLIFKPVIVFLIAPIIIAFFGAAAFYKVNDRPFLSYVAAFIKLSASSSRYTWQHGKEKTKAFTRTSTEKLVRTKKGAKTLSTTMREQREKNLFKIAWQMDVGSRSYNDEPPKTDSTKETNNNNAS